MDAQGIKLTEKSGETTIDVGPFRVEIRPGKTSEIGIRLLNEDGEESANFIWVDNFPGGHANVASVYLHLQGEDDPHVRAVDIDKVWGSE